MRITGINIEEGRIGGLKALKADKLGEVVVLAGRNGAGKTRLIRYLASWANSQISDSGRFVTPFHFINYGRKHRPELCLNAKTWNSWCSDDDSYSSVYRLRAAESQPSAELVRWTPFFGQDCVKLSYGDHGWEW